LAEMLRSYGASPEIIMATAAELSQSNATTDSASSANPPASTTLPLTASPLTTPTSTMPTSTTPVPMPTGLEPVGTTTTATPTASASAEPAPIVQAANLASNRLVIQHRRPPIMPTDLESRPTPLSSGSAGCETVPSST
ncbi:hypothetical protein FS837_007275, partial [Tulasnella sp. UAMH 9824]